MDLTAATADLAAAASDLVRLVPGRLIDPVLAGLLITADAGGVSFAGNDRERAARLTADALVHTDGQVLVPAKPFAETLRALDEPRVRLVVEGTRLAIRTPGARYALPLLDAAVHPGVPVPPPLAGTVDARLFASALGTVAAAASRDDALPMFTGVRVRSEGEELVLLATDRFQMALARMPWRPGRREVDALVPASLLTEIARQVDPAADVTLHADQDRFGLGWGAATVTTAVLDGTFLHESKIPLSHVDTELTLDADALAAAVRRVGLYTDARGVLTFEPGDGEVRLRGTDQHTGEADETVKSTVDGGRTPQAFQTRYLAAALRPFAGAQVRVRLQPGMRATTFTNADPSPVTLQYVVMPMLPPKP